MLNRMVLTGLSLAAVSGSVCAVAADGEVLGEVVVTATRSATPIEELATPVIVIERADIERSMANDLGALLKGHSGIEIARSGGPGQASSIFMRGTDSNHVTVLIDGVRINPGTIAGAPLENIQPEMIERVEIIKGARSSLYGSDAIGGVINIITRAGAAHGATLYAATGRYATQVYAASGGGALTDKLSGGGNFAWQASDGFPPFTGATDRGDYLNRSGNAQLRYAANDELTFHAQAWRASGHTAYSAFGLFPADQDYLDASYAAGADWQSGTHSARLNLSRVAAQIQQRGAADFDRTNRDALDFQAGWQLGKWQQLTVGTVLANEHTRSFGFVPFDVTTHTQLLFAQDQVHRGADDLLLALGHTRHETFGSRTTWNAEYGRTLDAHWRLSIAAGTAFHAPDSTDRYGYGGNPTLLPEFSHQGEVGLRWRPSGNHEVRLALFENHIDNLIQCLTIPGSFDCAEQNVGRARIRGAEFNWEWQIGLWRLRSGATLQNPRDQTSGQPLLRRAQRNLNASLLYQHTRWYSSGELQQVGTRSDYLGSTLGGYTLLDLGVGWSISPQWTLQARLENALDRRYQLAGGYNTAARAVTIAMRVHLR